MKKLLYIFLIEMILCCQSLSAQENSEIIRGKLLAESGEELVAATVLEIDATGRTVGNAQTDVNGEFSMKIKNSKNKLKFSYVGFTAQETVIGKTRVFNITLKEKNLLNEVVVTAKQTVSGGGLNIPMKEVSYAMQRVNAKAFEGMQINSIDDALQGHIAGLDITGSGNVGVGARMRIRGTASISSNAEPLIVINGIPREDIDASNFDFSTANDEQFANLLNVNPDDIMDITVLKDAASTAVWGAKGANGVLMIKMKKGIKGPTRINYTYKFTGARQPAGIEMLNGDNYTMLMKEAYFNPAQHESTIPEFSYNPNFSEYRYFSGNTDWREAVIQPGITNDHYLEVLGGSDKARFRVTGGYLDNKGTIIGQEWKRLTSLMDLDYDVSSRILFGAEFRFSYSDTDRSWSDGRDDNGYVNSKSILDIAYKKMPNLSIYDKDGGYYNIRENANVDQSQKDLRNPVALAHLATNNEKAYNIQPILRLRYDFLNTENENQQLRYEAYISFLMDNKKTHKYLPKEVAAKSWMSADINRSDDYDTESLTIQSENKITWKPDLGENHSFQLLAAVQTTSATTNSQSIVSYGFPSNRITDASSEGYLEKIASSIGQARSFGITGQAHYAYKSKYITTFSFRQDGSTRFGQKHKFGNFPGLSFRWNISDEPFMKFSNKWLDMLSIRPGWGITGNAPGKEYMHFSKYSAWESYSGQTTIRPENIRLSNLRWEKTNGFNLGMDLAFLDYTYVFDLNVYHQRTTDLLLDDPIIPTSTGYERLLYRNGGTMDNNGWELNFNANRFIRIGNVNIDMFFNIANSINTLIYLDEDILRTFNGDPVMENGKYMGRIQTGNAFGSIYGFRYKGVYEYNIDNYEKGTAPVARDVDGNILFDQRGKPLPMYFNYGENGRNYQFRGGDAMYEDINHDGTIDELDMVYLGNSNPKFNGGWGLTIRWKQFSCKAFMNFRYGNQIVNEARMYAENMYNDDNQSIAVNYRWRKEGDVTRVPRALHKEGYNWLASDRFVEDGSFLRFKYLTFNYSVPTNWISKYALKQMNFYVTFNNLLCITKYTGVDPEINLGSLKDRGVSYDRSTTPRSRDWTVGVKLGF